MFWDSNTNFLWVSDQAFLCLISEGMSVPDQACRSPIRHASLHWVSDQACQSLLGFWSGMSVSNGSLIRHVGLWSDMLASDRSWIRHISLPWVSDSSLIITKFSWTRKYYTFPSIHISIELIKLFTNLRITRNAEQANLLLVFF